MPKAPSLRISERRADEAFLSEVAVQLPVLYARCVEGDIAQSEDTVAQHRILDALYPQITRWQDIFLRAGRRRTAVPLSAVMAVWYANTPGWREWQACHGHDLQSGLMQALRPLIAAGRGLDAMDSLARRLVTASDEQWFLKLIRHGGIGAAITQEAATFGDSTRYDRELLESPDVYGGYRRKIVQAYELVGALALRRGQVRVARQAFTAAPVVYPWSSAISLGLAQIAKREGDPQRAMQYAAEAVLNIPYWSHPDAQESLHRYEDLYRATHQGTFSNADALLDSVYQHTSTYANPVQERPLNAQASSARRRILVQYETWVGCGPCTVKDLTAEALEQRYGANVIVLAYHYDQPFLAPGYSVGTVPSYYANITRQKTYQVCSNLFVDGRCPRYDVHALTAPGRRYGTLRLYDQVAQDLDRRLLQPSTARLETTLTYHQGRLAVQVHMDSLPHNQHPYRLHMVLAEDAIRYPGQEGIRFQRHVVRSIAGDTRTGLEFRLGNDSSATVVYTFDLAEIRQALYRRNASRRKEIDEEHRGPEPTLPRVAYMIDARHLQVVIYIQDDMTGEVLNAVAIPVHTEVR